MAENRTSKRVKLVRDALKAGKSSITLQIVGRYTAKDDKGKPHKYTTNDLLSAVVDEDGHHLPNKVTSYNHKVVFIPDQPEQVQLDRIAGLVIRLQNALRDELKEQNGHAEPKKQAVAMNAAFQISSLVNAGVPDAKETWDGFQSGDISLEDLLEFIENSTETEDEDEPDEPAEEVVEETTA